jgi:hypothetical protein
MTFFYRRRHERRIRPGVYTTVRETEVRRNDWGRKYSQPQSGLPAPTKKVVPVPTLEIQPSLRTKGAYTACFINPNAECWHCKQPVFYYQNEHNSRVLFDELGPPWPKHACPGYSHGQNLNFPVAGLPGLDFRVLSDQELKHKESGCPSDVIATEFQERYGSKPWKIAKIVRLIKYNRQCFMKVLVVTDGAPKKLYLSCATAPRYLKEGALVSIFKRTISMFDFRTEKEVRLTVHRYRSRQALSKALLRD